MWTWVEKLSICYDLDNVAEMLIIRKELKDDVIMGWCWCKKKRVDNDGWAMIIKYLLSSIIVYNLILSKTLLLKLILIFLS